MAGTLFGLPLSQQTDDNGDPIVGGLLYIYTAGTATPATVYQDSGLSAEHTNPLVTDSGGRIPTFWLADGSYRARFTNSSGIVQFDEDSILALGPSSGGGGGGSTVDPNAIFDTGDVLWRPTSGTRSGWVRANGRTIGSATSGAAERANSDVQALFEHLWNTYADSIATVSTGRGANALADWSANKTITTLDMRARSPVGLDDMGNTAASRLTGATFSSGSATAAASVGGTGAETLALTQIPSHDHGGTTGNDSPDHTHTAGYTNGAAGNVGSGVPTSSFAASGSTTFLTTGASARHTHSITAAGGGLAHNNMPPFMTGTWFIKL